MKLQAKENAERERDKMKKRIIAYTKRIDKCISGETPVENWEELLEEHIHQLEWFQHERIVHMFVMLAFAFFAVGTVFTFIITDFMPLLILEFLLMVLLIPYVKHYYLMENKCQDMLKQYDAIWAKVKEERRAKESAK